MNNSSHADTTSATSRLALSICGYPTFCSVKAYNVCTDSLLGECSECSYSMAQAVIAAFFIFAVVIVAFNLLVVVTVYTVGKYRSMAEHIKASLAIANGIVGVFIFAINIPNIFWTLDTKIADIRRWKTDSYGSAIANVGGMGFMLFYASSLNHLCYMTIQRFIAVKWPQYYNEQTLYRIYFHLLIVWAYSVLIASIPAMTTSTFGYNYAPNVFQYFPFAINGPGIRVWFAVLLMVPYLGMTVLNALTFDTIRRRFKKSKELRGNRYSDAVKDYEKKMRILKKLLAMQAGFSLIAVPPLVVSILFQANAFICYDASRAYLATNFVTYLACFHNVCIYSISDQHFRNAVCKIYKRLLRR
ncbi:uncharacterized protein LOC143450718 [Clavelina lepadiformis]|uniref:uncharacterized protein LOC143450718 n=1 Tax=Clavelina lepadiformis TaxID=159417 RepID=UPI004042DE6D